MAKPTQNPATEVLANVALNIAASAGAAHIPDLDDLIPTGAGGPPGDEPSGPPLDREPDLPEQAHVPADHWPFG